MKQRRKRSGVCEEEQLSCCALCQNVLKDPVSTSCGHWLCRQCISSYWDQSASSGDSSCPQCGERSRTRAGLQTASQSSCVQSKTEHLSADGLISENWTSCCCSDIEEFYFCFSFFQQMLVCRRF
uniref:RING-type domain-containing protein n=1 Tax=Maylandia zebra TaxID=106582 RepID=A0A3P9DI35_9CICH